MNKKCVMYVYHPYLNTEVTSDYVSVIVDAVRKIGYEVINTDRICRKNECIFVISALDAVIAHFRRCKYILLWVQGIAPEESYMRHHSRVRYVVLSFIEKKALQYSNLVFMVSEEQKKHYLAKYGGIAKKSFIMPCFNEKMDKESFLKHDYGINTFVYAGSLAKWQCFHQTALLFKKIEEKFGQQVNLRILTKEKNKAKSIIESVGIRNYSIDCVEKERVKEEMQNAKFGFCIREDEAVNRVATPTKLSSYVCNGVMPIYSSCVRDFHRLAKDSSYCFCSDDPNFMDKLSDSIRNKNIDGKDVYDEFGKIFGEYYSRNTYGGGYCENAERDIGGVEGRLDLSVVVPAYNMEKYLERCIDSIEKQKDIRLEVIIVNDGSQDHTLDVAKKIKEKYGNVKVVSKSNSGLFLTRLAGVKNASGEYVTFVDADDMVLEGCYCRALQQLIAEDADIVEFGIRKIKGNDIVYEFIPQNDACDGVQGVKRQLEKNKVMSSNCNKIYRRCLFENLIFDADIRSHEEDRLINIAVMCQAKRIISISQIGYLYNTREGSITAQRMSENYLEILKTCREMYRIVKELKPELSQAAGRDLCSHLCYCYINLSFMNIDEIRKERYQREILMEYNSIYGVECLDKYKAFHESKNRRIMMQFFRISPALTETIYRWYSFFYRGRFLCY